MNRMKARIDAQRIQILAATSEPILRQHLAIGKIPAVYRPAVDCGLREEKNFLKVILPESERSRGAAMQRLTNR